MFHFTISVGNFIVKLCYVLSLVGAVIYGIGLMSIGDILVGLIGIVAGILLVILAFYLLFIIIDIRQQLVNLNAKLDKKENKENL
ncbi:hypothetical protein LS74_006320 [Helicobacter magdeburgensis]|uniref:DUF4282 domain-containing protein n=1 Tax=Helicobacter magdeburgensis TaxID=471858 RepID=A0A4U8SYV5_9HELI|nr:hypothetical protein [Helicobacter magdeburgensis]TLD92063.1 hypothetical protein LS74_006320 [Helicobacter magdeburgensis]